MALEISTGLAHATLFLQGAHLASWQPVGEAPNLFLSSRSPFAEGRPIRGGVPVIFPWFGAHANDSAAPAHGLARTAIWELEALDVQPDQTVTVVLRMELPEKTSAWWQNACTVRHRLSIGADLVLALEVENRSEGTFVFEEALHTYFAVSDVRHTSVHGLAGAEFLDKTQGFQRCRHEADPLTFSGETDRIFVNTTASCSLDDPGLHRRIRVEKSGSASTVVWNPWAARALALSDLGPDQWPAMLCIESGNIGENAVRLAPGETHVMEVRVSVEKLR